VHPLSGRRAGVVLAILLAFPLLGDEGQWPPDQLASFDAKSWAALRARGLTFSPADLWDGNGGGLLTGTIQIGGCSASFASKDGLVLTNHHCAFDAIQLASTPERNYVRDGFVARGRAEEIPAKGGPSRALVLSRIEDVTERVRGPKSAFADAKSDLERDAAVERARKETVAECEKTAGARCQVASFYDGLVFKLQAQTEYPDVRLVYAPPRAVGEFGGEVDNFRWPRHTGDFSVLRVYVGPDGRPAPYAKENVPFHPARYFRVSEKGVAPGDLVMVLGYPGRTQRTLAASAVKNAEAWFYPLRSKTYSDLIAILEGATKDDPDASLRVSSHVKSLANVETNARGQIEGLRRNGVFSRVTEEERRFTAWLAKAPSAAAAERAAPKELEEILAKDRARQERRFFLEETERSPGLLFSALQAVRWAEERAKPDLERDAGYQQRDLARARDRERNATKSLVPSAQRKALAYLIENSTKASGAEPVAAFEEAFGKNASAAAIEKRLAELDASTRLADESVRLANLEAPVATLKASADPYIRLALALSPDLARLRKERKELSGALLRVRPAYLAALQAFRKSEGRLLYPDANSTLRVSFAEVKGYAPREALLAEPQTSTKGLLEKETGVEPFASPARVLKAVNERRFGRWEDARLGGVPVGFLSNADTTGGNSGSPAVNGRGELVGLNFDRVWENVAGDFGWNPERSRNVMVDVRYALWLVGDVDGQTWLVDELLGK
jgi:hypothetical protein